MTAEMSPARPARPATYEEMIELAVKGVERVSRARAMDANEREVRAMAWLILLLTFEGAQRDYPDVGEVLRQRLTAAGAAEAGP